MTLHLVRHGRPLIDADRPAAQWDLDPLFYDDVWALRASGRLPRVASWFCSPEPKAQQTAQLLTDGAVGIVDELREHERGLGLLDDFASVVERAFAEPDVAAVESWEPLSRCRDRLVPAVLRILDVHAGEDVVLVGHGTAWTVLVAALTAAPFDLVVWSNLAMPDVIELPH